MQTSGALACTPCASQRCIMQLAFHALGGCKLVEDPFDSILALQSYPFVTYQLCESYEQHIYRCS
jgi:hypothetical protein